MALGQVIVGDCEEKMLLSHLREGSEHAFGVFYEKYRAPIYRKILKMIHLEVVAEELLQDLFLKVWDKRLSIDPERSFKAYLYRIAQNLVYDYFRTLTLQAKWEKEFTATNSVIINPVEEAVYKKEIEKKIDEALDLLSPQQKLVYSLCKIEGKSYKEVSNLLGITMGTINVHITAANKIIKQHLLKGDHLAFVLLLSVAVLD